jgi:DNA modification methylase
MNEIKFKRDTAFRKQFFMPDSFAHPAKMDAQLLIWIVERYTKLGETILDPMAGSGTLMLACGIGRNVILVELEEKFCKMCRDNWEVVKMHPQLGSSMGECQIIQGDARNLEGLLADKIITSPPYGNIDSIITSPPYEGSVNVPDSKQDARAERLKKAGYNPKDYQGGKGRNLQQDWSYHPVDAVITSPPYERSLTAEAGDKGWRKLAEDPTSDRYGRKSVPSVGAEYSSNLDNIGNLKSDSYLSAMLQVYRQCYGVLKSGGLMILVTKDFIRNKKRVYLSLDTIRLCEQAGFVFEDWHERVLTQQSFWRVIYYQRCWRWILDKKAVEPVEHICKTCSNFHEGAERLSVLCSVQREEAKTGRGCEYWSWERPHICELRLRCPDKRPNCSNFWNDAEKIETEDILVFNKVVPNP